MRFYDQYAYFVTFEYKLMGSLKRNHVTIYRDQPLVTPIDFDDAINKIRKDMRVDASHLRSDFGTFAITSLSLVHSPKTT